MRYTACYDLCSIRMVTREEFDHDRTGRKFADVAARPEFEAWLAFFNDDERRRRMVEAEQHHRRPALAGVILELEQDPAFVAALAEEEAAAALRVRQAIGLLVKLTMADLGWVPTRTKGPLGRRARNVAAGEGLNTVGSLSRWFTRAEHYRPAETEETDGD